MPREKFVVGEQAEVNCPHVREGRVVRGWLAGRVVAADYRMVAVEFDSDVFAGNGLQIPERILWCAHGSPNIRRPAARTEASRSQLPQGE